MPVTRLDEDEHGLIKDTMHALVACFHLLNTDQEFANRISEEMDNIIGSGRIENPAGKTSSKKTEEELNLLSDKRLGSAPIISEDVILLKVAVMEKKETNEK